MAAEVRSQKPSAMAYQRARLVAVPVAQQVAMLLQEQEQAQDHLVPHPRQGAMAQMVAHSCARMGRLVV